MLKQKKCNPFFDDPETSHLLMNSNLDPDANFFAANSQLLSNCLYLTSTEFNKIPPLCSDTFSSLHINIRSLPKHSDDLSEFLLTSNRYFSIIAVSETWLHRSKSDLFHLSGYYFISSRREHKAGGGVGIYIQSHLKFKLRTDLQSSDNALCESVLLEIIQPRRKNIIVGCFYRPPDASVADFNNSLEGILSTISFEKKLSYLMGDFNINILNSQSYQPSNEFVNLVVSNSLYPLICKQTRITSTTATLIDNIFTNNLEHCMNSGIFYSDLSDHLPIFQVTHLKLDAETPCRKRLARLINPATIAAFRSKLETIDWSVIYNSDSTNDSYDTFSSLLISAYHKSFPLKPVYPESGRSFKTWFSKGLFVCCIGRILFINNSKQTLLNPTNLDITSIEMSAIFSIELLGKNIFMTN